MKGSSVLAPIYKRLENKVALITGGASGIGEATARLFAKQGAKVVIADVQDELGRTVCAEIGSNQDQSASYVHCDVTKETDIQDAVDHVMKSHGKLDVMFSNAGICGVFDPRISSVDYESYRKVFDVNVYGSFMAAKHAARVMVPAKRGSILFTASAASVVSGDVPQTYGASKHAIVGLMKNLAVELGQSGIRVNCVSPYCVATPLLADATGGLDEEKLEELTCASANLKGVVLKAEDAAEAALYLASNESKYVSGLNLVVDGGYSTTNVALGYCTRKLLSSVD